MYNGSLVQVKKDYTYVKYIGVELEGAWNGFEPLNYKHDGSVDVDVDCDDCYVGESNSDPMEPRMLEAYLDENYPCEHNYTCGIHVHVSLKDKMLYPALTTEEFHTYLYDRMKDWGDRANLSTGDTFFSRLKGNNTYCLPEYMAEKQLTDSYHYDNRYFGINYCSYQHHGTIEFRFLPVFYSVTVARNAIMAIVNGVDEFIGDNLDLCDDTLHEGECDPVTGLHILSEPELVALSDPETTADYYYECDKPARASVIVYNI